MVAFCKKNCRRCRINAVSEQQMLSVLHRTCTGQQLEQTHKSLTLNNGMESQAWRIMLSINIGPTMEMVYILSWEYLSPLGH